MKTSNLTGAEIRDLRHTLNLKQKECADAIGISLRQWQKFEAGTPCKQIYIDVLRQKANQDSVDSSNISEQVKQ